MSYLIQKRSDIFATFSHLFRLTQQYTITYVMTANNASLRDCLCVSVAAGGRRPAGRLRLFVCVIALFTRIHLCQYRYLAVFHKDRFWVLFFSCYTLHLSLLSSNVIRSSIIHTQTTPNSRTLLLRIAFLTSLTLCGFASTT